MNAPITETGRDTEKETGSRNAPIAPATSVHTTARIILTSSFFTYNTGSSGSQHFRRAACTACAYAMSSRLPTLV